LIGKELSSKRGNDMKTRHLRVKRKHTTVSLEPGFWQAIDNLSNGNWQLWAKRQLRKKPGSVGMASWLRVCALNDYQRHQQDRWAA
jgi:predicted DNA-binding ribbon-helix-helix protein